MMATAQPAERYTDTEPEFSLQIAELLPEFAVSVEEVFDAD
jgi:hypothetical protein